MNKRNQKHTGISAETLQLESFIGSKNGIFVQKYTCHIRRGNLAAKRVMEQNVDSKKIHNGNKYIAYSVKDVSCCPG